MGKSYSKQEEIVIAQNGANGASTSSMEKKMEVYGIVITCVVVLLLLIGVYIVMHKCNKSVKKWARKEMLSAVSVIPVDKPSQQPAQTAYM